MNDERIGQRSGGSRQRRRRRAEAPPRPLRARRLQLNLVGKEAAQSVHEVVIRILSEIGVLIEDEPTRRMMLSQTGCREGSGGYVRIFEDLVQRSLETAPPKVVLYDRDGNQVVDTSGRVPAFCVGHNCVNVLDHETGEHRPGTLADIVRTARVTEGLPNVDVVASLGYPTDVPVEKEAELSVTAMIENTRKPVAFTGHDEVEANAIWSCLADAVGGWANLAEKPCGLDLTGPVSPLKLGEEFCRRLKMAAERHLPVVCFPALFPGMSGPITLAGAIAQSSAESLAGVVIHQLTNPGAPIMAGSSILPMDMRRADLAYGSPELMLAGIGAVDYFNSIGLPCWVGAGSSDSHAPDLQAAAEVGANMTLAAMTETGLIHRLGFLSGGRTGSLEMLVLCDELASMVNAFAGGIIVDDETLAFDVIKRAAAENSFLADEHTMARYMTEMWIPGLFERSDLGRWREEGATHLRERIKDRLSDLLK